GGHQHHSDGRGAWRPQTHSSLIHKKRVLRLSFGYLNVRGHSAVYSHGGMTLVRDCTVRTLVLAIVLGGALIGHAACACARGRVCVRVGPPAPVVERVVVAPGPGYVWTPGYYRWDGRAYVWIPGRHVLAPRPHAVWVQGHWVRERRGWYWIDGHWRAKAGLSPG